MDTRPTPFATLALPELAPWPAILLCEPAAEDPPAEFVLPSAEELAALDAEALAALETEAVAAFDALRDGEDLDEAALAAMTDLAASIETIREETGRRAEAAEAARAAAEELAARVHPTDPPEGAEEAEETPEGAEGATGEAPPPEGAGDPPAGQEEAEVPAAQAASGTPTPRPRPTRVPLGDVAARARRNPAPPVAVNDGATVAITAAADIPGIPAGGTLTDIGAVAAACTARARLLGDRQRASIATFTMPAPRRDGRELVLTEQMSGEAQMAVLQAAASPVGRVANQDGSLLTAERGGNLVAAGGWCAPSERQYGFVSLEGRGGLLDLPRVNIRRGGIEFIEDGGPQLASVLAVGWTWTEADDIAALTDENLVKPCVRVPCPEWIEERLEAHGICITAGNLQDRAFPEMTRRFIDLVLAGHAHVMNAGRVDALVAASTAVELEETFGALTPVLSGLDLQGWDTRDKYRMDDNTVLEVVLPSWFIGVARADIARRTGVDPMTITRQRVEAEFTARNLRVQWVQDWQPLQTANAELVATVTNKLLASNVATITTAAPHGFVVGRRITVAGVDATFDGTYTVTAVGSSTTFSYAKTAANVASTADTGTATDVSGFRTSWPGSIDALLYPAGTFVLGTGGTLDLGVIRDSRLNEQNDHTAAWTEEFDLIAKMGPESRVVTIPICPDGQAGGKPIVDGDYACPIP